jgi:hypothetical protein
MPISPAPPVFPRPSTLRWPIPTWRERSDKNPCGRSSHLFTESQGPAPSSFDKTRARTQLPRVRLHHRRERGARGHALEVGLSDLADAVRAPGRRLGAPLGLVRGLVRYTAAPRTGGPFSSIRCGRQDGAPLLGFPLVEPVLLRFQSPHGATRSDACARLRRGERRGRSTGQTFRRRPATTHDARLSLTSPHHCLWSASAVAAPGPLPSRPIPAHAPLKTAPSHLNGPQGGFGCVQPFPGTPRRNKQPAPLRPPRQQRA